MALWSGRFQKGMSAAMRRVNHSLATDIALLPSDLVTNREWATSLHQIGILSADELAAIHSALLVIADEYASGAYHPLPDDEDVHSLVERRLTELVGPSGGKIHTGRSRNDQVATDIRLYLRDGVVTLQHHIRALIATLVSTATSHTTTVMPSFTHVQHAQPIVLAHYLLSLAWALKEDWERLDTLRKGTLALSPLGSGAVAGAAFPIDRTDLAKRLGFEGATPNSIHAISERDDIVATLSATTLVMLHLSRYAEDWIMWSSPEFGFISLDESVSTGSSMMPQKKNPDSLELIRGKSARAIGHLTAILALVKGLPLTYSRDLQEDKQPMIASLTDTIDSILLMDDVVASMTWHADRMEASVEGGLLATDVADYLTRKGLPFRQAHEVAATIVRTSLDEKTDFRTWTPARFATFSPLFEADITTSLTTPAALTARNLIGGTGPESVDNQIDQLKGWASI